ncbi:MAG: YSC84-related protein [Myxococcota bacterium]|nr:YSC84-related protein [Myxococcota bacterium]
MRINIQGVSTRAGVAMGVGRGLLIVLAVTLAFSGCKTPAGETGNDQRATIRSSNQEILKKVYAEFPAARGQVNQGVAYATFSTIDAKILFGGTGNGYGLLTEKSSGQQTFMRMAKLQVGFGLGVQELSLLLVFKTDKTLKQFKEEGWTFGGGASAALKSDQGKKDDPSFDKSMKATLDQDPLIYQVTNKGVNISATLDGFKFSRDGSLN